MAKQKEKEKEKDKKPVARRQPNVIQRFFNETMGELRKVSWPTRKEAANLTVIVLMVLGAMTVVLGVLDWIYSRVFALILS
ncbi:MAG: preprotein translocase subunit SecE [Chloroflexota bacterium]